MAAWWKNVKPGWLFTVTANQGEREAEVLAVRGNQALAEYSMPAGTTALVVLTMPDQEDQEPAQKGIGYKTLSMAWLEAIVAAETTWIGKPQQSGGRTMPTPSEMLRLKRLPGV